MKPLSQDIILQEIKVKESAELLQFLEDQKVRKSRNAIKSLLAHKQVNVNGKLTTQYNHPLKSGDVVRIMKFNQERKRNKLKGLTIEYEDEYIIVVNKEYGVLSISTDKEKTRTVYNVLTEHVKKKKKLARIFVLHRLDREVSGLMIFAKDENIQFQYQQNWDKLVPKYMYLGVTEGIPEQPAGTIKSWLTEDKNYVMRTSDINNGGLESITHYKTIKSNDKYALLSYRLETRRKNQIRAQMKQIGHPIVGDKKYGAKENPIKRIALHVQDMLLIHPVLGSRLEFNCPAPKAMMQLVNKKELKQD
jgi:23S rRNA pseudouridine1911/1915/1917 synthase